QDHVEGGAGPHESREALATAGARQDAKLDFGKADLRLRVIARDAVTACERELEPATQAGALDARGDGLRKPCHLVEHVLPVRREPLCFGGGGQLDEFLD